MTKSILIPYWALFEWDWLGKKGKSGIVFRFRWIKWKQFQYNMEFYRATSQ